MSGAPAAPQNSAYSDQPNEAATPKQIRLSMVTAAGSGRIRC
jgi:hypothetical protein